MNPFQQSHKQISIFVTAGYPTVDSLPAQITQLNNQAIDFIEVGIPFSDPLADGPTIQQTSAVALKNGMNLELLFEQLDSVKSVAPLVLMGYLNPVIKFGIERFLKKCTSTGISSVILPDMSVEIYDRLYREIFEQYNVHPAFLITPNTSNTRIKEIAKKCKNSFVYLVSTNATTGANTMQIDLSERYKEIKVLCGNTPLFIGFGIRDKKDVDRVHQVCDGAIIGTAFLNALRNRTEVEFIQGLR